jgi:hypothetical protein
LSVATCHPWFESSVASFLTFVDLSRLAKRSIIRYDRAASIDMNRDTRPRNAHAHRTKNGQGAKLNKDLQTE